MPRGADSLFAEFPELKPLSPDELRAYLAAFHARRVAPNVAIAVGSLVLGAMTCITVGTVVAMILSASLRATRGFDREGLVVAGSVIAAVLGTIWTVRRYRRHIRTSSLIIQIRGVTRCAGCRYDIRGVEPLDSRPGVVRCPECGLVNPAP